MSHSHTDLQLRLVILGLIPTGGPEEHAPGGEVCASSPHVHEDRSPRAGRATTVQGSSHETDDHQGPLSPVDRCPSLVRALVSSAAWRIRHSPVSSLTPHRRHGTRSNFGGEAAANCSGAAARLLG